MDWIRDLTAASIALYGFAAAEAAFVRWRRPRDVEHGIFGALCALLCLFAAMRIAFVDGPHASAFDALATIVALFTYAVVLHLAAVNGEAPHAPRWIVGAYVGAAVLSIVALVGDHGADGRSRFGLSMIRPHGSNGALLLAGATVAAILAAFHWSRAALAKKPGALSLTLGALGILVSTGHDLIIATGLWVTSSNAQLGFIAFMPAYGGFLAARYLALTTDLEARSAELAGTSRELMKSYDELRATQEELVRKEQLAVVGELAAVVAHEVRNPLAVIGNAVAGLRKDALSKEDHATLLGILEEEASRLNRLVSDLLRFARPVSVQRAPVDLEEILARAIMIAEKATRVTVTKKIELGDEGVWADGSLLRQVFDNLVDNAVQAMGTDGGDLSISAGPRSIEGIDCIAVEIKDTGEGMDTLVRQRARDPFFTTRPSGTGLGLAIVDRIVDAHGGHLLIESHPGAGTAVTVVLPAGRPSDVPRALPPQPAAEEAPTS